MRTEWICLVRPFGKRNGFTCAYQKDFIAESRRFDNAPPAFGEMFRFFGVLNFDC
jgi:hypothetical protein